MTPPPELRLTVEQLAEICHEANRGYQAATGHDFISQPWATCPTISREATIAGVEQVMEGLTPEECHHNWVALRREQGFLVGNNDHFAHTHPNMVPYDQLPAREQQKNLLFAGVVNSLKHLVDTTPTSTQDG